MPHKEFEKLLTDKINLSQPQISQGSTSHLYVRGVLENKSKEDNDLPWLIEGDFLSGSYARKTKIKPLDDIDVMIVLDGSGLSPISEGRRLDATVEGKERLSNPIYSHTNEEGYISSKKVLESFRKHLNQTYPDSKIKKDGQAVNIDLNSYGMGLDIVPCLHILPNNGSQDFYYIPYGRESDMWMPTNPKIDAVISDKFDSKFDNKLKPVIKLIKYWNQTQNNGRLKSYHLEVIIWKVFEEYNYKIDNYAYALKFFFNNANKYLVSACSDPTKLGENIDSYLMPIDRRLSTMEIEKAKNIVNEIGVFSSDLEKITKWRKIFGQQFGG